LWLQRLAHILREQVIIEFGPGFDGCDCALFGLAQNLCNPLLQRRFRGRHVSRLEEVECCVNVLIHALRHQRLDARWNVLRLEARHPPALVYLAFPQAQVAAHGALAALIALIAVRFGCSWCARRCDYWLAEPRLL